METQRDLSPVGPLDRVEHAVGQGDGGGLAGLVVLDQPGQHAVGPTAHRLPSTAAVSFFEKKMDTKYHALATSKP